MDYARMTWEDLAKICLMTEEELAVIDKIPHSIRLLKLGLEPYVRHADSTRYPALNSHIVEDMWDARSLGNYEHSAYLKACMQRRMLDGHQGKVLMAHGITDLEIMLHEDACSRGLRPRDISLFKQVWNGLTIERPWPWENATNASETTKAGIKSLSPLVHRFDDAHPAK